MQYKKKLDFFLGQENEYSGFNVRMYDALYNDLDISPLFSPVDFFEITYNEFLFFYHHCGNYIEITEHFKDFVADVSKRYYILYYLSQLINIEYADKDTGRYIVRHEDIVLSSCAYINKLFKKSEKEFDDLNKKQQVIHNGQVDQILWQYPQWDKTDFVADQKKYRHFLREGIRKNKANEIEGFPYYEIRTGETVCARFSPTEYFNLLTYDIELPKTNEEPDWEIRIKALKKIKSNIKTLIVGITTTNDIGKKYKDFFDIGELLSNVDVYIENVEAALDLKGSNPGKGINANLKPVSSDEQKLSFNPKTYGKDEIINILNFCATQIEKWQIDNTLNDLFNDIPDNGKSYVYSNRFEFLQKLRIELENNSIIFSNDEAKFREIEKWTVEKMGEKVITQVSPLKFEVNKVSSSKQSGSKPTIANSGIEKFKDIFVEEAWEKYVTALEKTSPVLFTGEWRFIGNRKKHIGVVCSWFKDLQGKGIIKQNISRSKLASVLNQELQDFNMGTDGKTFDNISAEYAKFKQQLTDLTT